MTVLLLLLCHHGTTPVYAQLNISIKSMIYMQPKECKQHRCKSKFQCTSGARLPDADPMRIEAWLLTLGGSFVILMPFWRTATGKWGDG